MSNNNDNLAPAKETDPNENQPCSKNPEASISAGKPAKRSSLYEKNRRAVYATGNKWAIENFHATHD